MADEHSVKSAQQDPHSGLVAPEPDTNEDSARWWQRQPALGIVAALASGLFALWLLRSLGAPARSHAATFLYMVTLPIALLLPAGALAGAVLAWGAFSASRGLGRAMLAIPAAAALVVNVVAIGLFVRFVISIFTR